MAKKPVAKKTKTRKKRWYPIVAPKIFNEQVIGESLLYEPNSAIGKTAAANLMHLTQNAKNQSITIKFIISNYKDNKLETEFDSYEMGYASIKRLVRRNQDKLEDSIVAKSADDIRVRVKPLVLTRYRTKSSVKMTLRKIIRQELLRYIKKNKLKDIFTGVVSRKFQRELRDKLNKIYPVRICDIRVLAREKRAKAKDTAVAEEPKEKLKEESSEKTEETPKEKKEEKKPKEKASKKKKEDSEKNAKTDN